MTATIATTLNTHDSGKFAGPFTGVILGFIVTASLFWLMQNLIDSADGTLGEKSAGALVPFVRVEREEVINKKPPKPTPPLQPKRQPPQPKLPNFENPNVVQVTHIPAEGLIDPGAIEEGAFKSEGDYLPIVKVAPIYPTRALQRGVEGSCVVQYTVTRLGTIANPMIVDGQCSSSLFHQPSLSAAMKFKYKPRVVNGVEVEVSGVQNKFTYKIDG